MTDENKYIQIEAKGFQDLCKHIAELEAENEKLILENKKLNRIKKGLMLNNSKITQERNDLIAKVHFLDQKCKAYHKEVLEIISMDMWEFANTYCNDAQLEKAGHQLAQSLIGGK